MTVGSSGTGHEVVAAYRVHDRNLRVRYSLVGHALIVVLMPLGIALDWYIYPDALNEFLIARLAVAAVAGIAFGLHYVPLVQRQISWFSMVVPLLVNAAMSWMILRTEGVHSPYYAGLNLLITAMGVLVPWSFAETTFACILTIGFYVVACALHGEGFVHADVLFNNLYFLVLTSIICATSAHFKARARFEEFRLRSELAHSYQQVTALERAKTELFANVSHELRTPLTLILAPLGDLLRRPAWPEDVRELLTLAHGNSLRLLKLINDLLELIRIESQDAGLVAEPIELGQFVKAQSESIRQLARLKGLDLLVEVPETPVWTMVDPIHLEKILVNLLTNAVKFTPEHGRISVSLRQQGPMAVVEVTDTGIGISEADLPHIFDRFWQADGSATRRFSGMGIGLSLARQLAQKHGAEISVESRPDQGSTFRLHVPSRPLAGDLAFTQQNPENDPVARLFRDADRFIALDDEAGRPPVKPSGPSNATVLVIDDEPDMRRYLASILADRYRVLSVSDGVAGLAVAREARPELVLVDLMMPGMDGWQVCATLKQELAEQAPKIVVVTARTDEMAKIRALEQGADDFLTKPFSTLEVRTRLANLLRAQTLERSLRAQNAELAAAMSKLETAEAQLIRREKMVAVSRMAGGILHEINNPLNYTLTAIGIALAQAPATDASLRDILRDVQSGMQRIRDIVADLRDFAVPGKTAPRTSFALGRTVERALQLTGTQLASVRVERELPQPCLAYGSESQVLQVLVNLLLNAEAALRASRADRPPTIRIGATADQRRLRVYVRDNGTGMPATLLDKVFDPFVTTRDVGQGMGLGLSICNTLVEAHGGSMSVRSEEGEWTEVAFELPLQPKEGIA